jgi:hypothetical protein
MGKTTMNFSDLEKEILCKYGIPDIFQEDFIKTLKDSSRMFWSSYADIKQTSNGMLRAICMIFKIEPIDLSALNKEWKLDTEPIPITQ